MKTRNKHFRPAKVPRYLPGEVSNVLLQYDLAKFNKHRFRLFTIKAAVDSSPPKMNPHNYLNSKKMLEDATRLRRIDLENKELLKKINMINRLGGKVDSYNPNAYRSIDKWRAYNSEMKRLEKQNRSFLKLLTHPLSSYDTKKLEEEWEVTVKKMRHACRYPLVIDRKFSLDLDLKRAQSISYLLPCKRPELRSHCFLDFSLDNGKHLGRIVVELYFDHVPVTVQNFLEICRGEGELTYNNSPVHRIILGEYMEMGDITHGTGRGGFSIYGQSFPEENHRLKHTKAGVLSMKRVGWTENNSQFCITFKKMEQWDHKNVVFGNVVKGNDVLMNIQFYGRKIGKPLENIVISDCGECENGY